MKRLWLKKCWLPFFTLSLSCAFAEKESRPFPQSQIDAQALTVLQISHQNYEDNIKDYKCIFLKRGRISGRLGDFEVVQMKLWQGELLGEYIYKNVEINAGLTDEDFDPKNKAYNFP